MKIKWQVQSAPTGRYRSFQKRGWPSGHYESEQEHPAISIYSESAYVPRDVKDGNHAELKVNIAFYPADGTPGFTWRTLKTRFRTLAEAKAAGEAYLVAHPEIRHPDFREVSK